MRKATLSAFLIAAFLFSPPTEAADRRPGWAAEDGCRNTRAVVMAEQCSLVTWDRRGCTVRQATCFDVYSDTEISADTAAQAFQVDHVFPYSEAAKRRTWTAAEMRQFYNDHGNLLVVRSRTNGRKGDKMPNEWCPATACGRRVAAGLFTYAATRYDIPVTAEEWAGVEAWRRGECAPGAVVITDP